MARQERQQVTSDPDAFPGPEHSSDKASPPSRPQVRVEEMPEGCVVYRGDVKLAVLTTSQHLTRDAGGSFPRSVEPHEEKAVKEGVVVWDKMPREAWTVHFCSPIIHVQDLEEVIAVLPK